MPRAEEHPRQKMALSEAQRWRTALDVLETLKMTGLTEVWPVREKLQEESGRRQGPNCEGPCRMLVRNFDFILRTTWGNHGRTLLIVIHRADLYS